MSHVDIDRVRADINWFQRALTRLQGNQRISVVEEFERENTEFEMGLPPELWEKIISLINEDSTLFTCRLVNREWNRLATDLLEKLHHEKWNSWEPVSQNASEPPFTPTLLQSHTRIKSQGYSHLYLPPVLKRYRQIESNPFPANSLRISYNHMRLPISDFFKSSIKWNSFFIKFCHFLSSIILDNVQISFSQISLILTLIPNLKALTLRNVIVYEIPINKPAPTSLLEKMSEKIPIPSHLQTLQCLGCNNEKIVSWLLDNLAQHIHNLKMELGGYRPGLLSDATRNFENLQQLKITYPRPHPPTEKIWDPETYPKNLQRISVFIPIYSEDVHWLYEFQCSGAVKFVCQFVSTLVHLRLSIEFKKLLGYLTREGVVFENLRTISLAAKEYERGSDVNWRDVLLKEKASKWLPNLQSVMFGGVKYNMF